LNFIEKLKQKIVTSSNQADTSSTLESMAILMVSMAAQDDVIKIEELVQIKSILSKYSDSDEDVDALLNKAMHQHESSHDFYKHTKQLIVHYTQAERIELIKHMWSIALADGEVDPYEEQLVRKFSELLGVHHHKFISAKQQAKIALT